jgi:hypothetical protein
MLARMSMPRRARSLAAALAAAALVVAAPSALAVTGHPAGVLDQFSLGDDQLFQTLGQPYDVAATANGTAAIGWISASSTQSGPRAVHLCKLEVGATSCTGGVQSTGSLAFASAGDPQVVITSDGVVHLIWWHDSSGPSPGAIAEATAPDGQNLSAGHDVAALPTSVGTLMAAKLGPGDSIWTVTYDAVPGQHIEVRPGLTAAPESVPTPFAIGYAQLAFVGDQAVLTVQEYGSIATPPYYAIRSSNGTWSSFQPLANTWAVGTNVALATTGHGLRLVTAIGNASYRAVISKWTGSAFGKPRLTPDKNSCTPNTHDGWADASDRLLDASWECEQVAVANYPDALHPALFRLKTGGTPTYQAQVASGTRGIATLVYTVQSATANDMRVAHVLLPDSTRTVSKKRAAGRVTVTGPRSCLPPVNVHVASKRKPAGGWTVNSSALKLGGKAVSSPLDGATLAPGKKYTLVGTATFSKQGKTRTVTAKLVFKTCAAA